MPGSGSALHPALRIAATLGFAAVQLLGVLVFGWSALMILLLWLADDAWLAMATWVRTAWARTQAGEDWGERAIAIVMHAFLDSLTLLALAMTVLIVLPWPDGATFAQVWAEAVDASELAWGLVAGGVLAGYACASQWSCDRSGRLPTIDEIRRQSRVLTRFLTANIALLAALPWTLGAGSMTSLLIGLVLVRTGWVVWLNERELVHSDPSPAQAA